VKSTDLAIDEFYYDGRSDLSEEEKARKDAVDEIDKLIKKQHYSVTPVIDFEKAKMDVLLSGYEND
jgi:hypothetical protein